MDKLGFGMMRLPLSDDKDNTSINQQLVNNLVDAFLQKGFRYFDTAYGYHSGESEIALKKALVERYPRAGYLIADKMPSYQITNSNQFWPIFEEQLERCGVEYFDYYLLHTLGLKNNEAMEKYGGFEFMQKIKQEGKAKHIGFSFHDKAELLDKILTKHPEMEFVQLQINYLDWESECIESRKCYETAVKHGKKVIVMEPLKGGTLASVPDDVKRVLEQQDSQLSPAAWAIRFAASLENVMIVLSGMNAMNQVEENTNTMLNLKVVSEEEHELLMHVAEIIKGKIAIACTKCNYCTEKCPQKIAIPQYFALYNDAKQFGRTGSLDNYYMNLSHEHGKPSNCIECGQCERRCPQHLQIIDYLKQVSELFVMPE